MVAGKPVIDLELEVAAQSACRSLIAAGVVKSAHDCSDGGLAVAIAESAIIGGIGACMDAPLSAESGNRWDAALFGEGQSRIVISVSDGDVDAVSRICDANDVPWARIGTVGGDLLSFGDLLSIRLAAAADAHANGLADALDA